MASDDVIEVSDQTFQAEILDSDIPAIVDFWAIWCGPCKAIAPTVAQLATKFKGRVKVAKMDIDHNQNTPVTYRIQAIPTLVAFKGGEVVDQLRGPRRTDLERFFETVADS